MGRSSQSAIRVVLGLTLSASALFYKVAAKVLLYAMTSRGLNDVKENTIENICGKSS